MKRTEHGFTLIELLIVTAIAGIMLAATSVFFFQFRERIELNSQREAGLQACKSELEYVKALDFDAVKPGMKEGGYFSDETLQGLPNVRKSVWVSVLSPDLYDVQVVLTFSSTRAKTRLRLETLKGRL